MAKKSYTHTHPGVASSRLQPQGMSQLPFPVVPQLEETPGGGGGRLRVKGKTGGKESGDN